jgi:putative NADH-flavin reductase
MIMKIVVIGGTGLIGAKLVNKLREHKHEAVAAAPNTGVNTITGEGLAEMLKGASVVVDSPSWKFSGNDSWTMIGPTEFETVQPRSYLSPKVSDNSKRLPAAVRRYRR